MKSFVFHLIGKKHEHPIGELLQSVVGFQTDFASIPSLFWMMLPPDGQYTAAAVVHDYLYFTQTRTRLASDRIFLEAMKVLKVNIFKRLVMFKAVRTFSFIPWNRRARQIKKNLNNDV